MTAPAVRYMVMNWRELPRWDMKTARASAFRRAHPDFRPLGVFAEEATELVRPWTEPEKDWPVYGVNNEAGVVFSHYQRGDSFNSPYKRIQKDWFFHNPTRANVGSLGRVPEVPDDAITSPEYQVWRITSGILPEFVELLIRTAFFIEQVACHRVGAVKERLYVQNLLEIPVPVVSLAAQRKIVAIWEASRKTDTEATERVAQLERDIETRFLDDLGLKPPRKTALPKYLSVRWSELLRWSVRFNTLYLTKIDMSSGKYREISLGDVATVSYGVQKCPSNRPGQHPRPYLRVANVQRGVLDLNEIKYINVSDSELPSYLLKKGDVLFVEGNGSRTELGRCAIWNGEINGCVHQNHILKVRPRLEELLPEFAMTWFNTEVGKNHFFRNAKTSSGLGTINSTELRAAPIPIPPLTVQHKIMERVFKLRDEISKIKEKARVSEESAREDVEKMILGIKPVK